MCKSMHSNQRNVTINFPTFPTFHRTSGAHCENANNENYNPPLGINVLK